MSLVDYASSSDDDVSEGKEENREDEAVAGILKHQSSTSPAPPPPSKFDKNKNSGSLSNRQQDRSASAQPTAPPRSIEKLPDASLLLSSTTISMASVGTTYGSRASTSMAENALRKRDVSGLTSSSLPRSKVPKGTLPHTKDVPDTIDGVLVPPQLKGRSNVVTEDIGKLFVKRHSEPSSR